MTFKLEKETKNTVRYAEEAEGRRPVVGTVYIHMTARSCSTRTFTFMAAPPQCAVSCLNWWISCGREKSILARSLT